MSVPDPGTYAKLPAGTKCYWAAADVDYATTPESFKLLKDADAIGVTGKQASFNEITRLIDEEAKFMSSLPEGPDKELVFLDDPSDTDLQAFLAAAEARQTVQFRVEFPNQRWALMVIALGAWSLQELDKKAPMKIVVNGKQNAITRGITSGS